MNQTIRCFEPIIDKDCEMLILGSIPSKKSRENNFYYSNPTNRFWKILSKIFNEDFINMGNNDKQKALLKHHIALYDLYSTCQMKKNSSLDSDIINPKINDILSLIKDTKVRAIYITSKKAYNEFFKKNKDIPYPIIYLPSPSSANRSIFKTDEELIAQWRKLIK